MHTHVVFFWLNEEVDDAGRKSLADDCHALLGPIETVRELRVGTPAETFREIVDRSYDLAIVVTFHDLAGHDIYQDHPEHHKFVERHAFKWKKCQVYDIT